MSNDSLSLVKSFLPTEEFQSRFPELEGQFAYYNELNKKAQSKEGCSKCTLNKLKSSEAKVHQTIASNISYYRRFEDFVREKGIELEVSTTTTAKPKADQEYVDMKLAVAERFKLYPVSKSQFIQAIRIDSVRTFLQGNDITGDLSKLLFEEFKSDTDVTHSIKVSIDDLYDLIWSNEDVVRDFYTIYAEEFKVPNRKNASYKSALVVKLFTAESLQELEEKVNIFVANKSVQSITTTANEKEYLSTVLFRQ